MIPFRLGVVTDELDPDLERALALARELEIPVVELNQIGDRNIVELSDPEILVVERLLAAGKAEVIAIDPPCFKPCVLDHVPLGQVTEEPEVAHHLRLLDRALTLAQRLNAPFVRVFSFRRSGIAGLGNPSPRLPEGGSIPAAILYRIAEALQEAARHAEEAKITLVLENVRSCWANTGVNTATVLDAVGSPRLKALWDPGNDYVSGGVPYPNGYEAIRNCLQHVHIKDARVVDSAGLTSWEPIGEGEIDYLSQVRALVEDGYPGVVSLETHWRDPGGSAESASRRSLAGLRTLLRELSDSAVHGV